MEPLVTIYLGLGSNLGDRQQNLFRALQSLAGCQGVEVIRASSVYETAPWGHTDQPNFLNCVVEAGTHLTPVELLSLVKDIENDLGRKETFRYGPRVIDIDILLYGDHVIHLEEPDLQIPHARMAERVFVLVPLGELVPELVHPVEKVSIESLAEAVVDEADIKLWGPPLVAPPEA